MPLRSVGSSSTKSTRIPASGERSTGIGASPGVGRVPICEEAAGSCTRNVVPSGPVSAISIVPQ